jgi:hypothetical protein
MPENKPIYNPWVGLASYEDPKNVKYKPKFCGRDNESYDVANLIRNNIFVTLYGKSGIGKTSLINAGVIPDLREDRYMPLNIRLGLNDDDKTNYQTVIIRAIERTANHAGITIKTFDVVPEQAHLDAPDFLWNYFARHHFVDKNDTNNVHEIFPVIVFDQFEEVLRAHRDQSEVLLRQLHYMVDKDHRIDNCEIDGKEYHYEFNFRFVVSIREDDLYRLEDCIDDCFLASLKRCRYRLRSLTEQGARDVILIPGEGLFHENEQNQIVESIVSKVRNKEDLCINSYLLSLVCYRIFIEYTHRSDDHIGQPLVDEYVKGNIFERFYDEATESLSSREKAYIEDNFVDSTGRRNSIPESDFQKHVPHGDCLLNGDNRILQRISSSSGSNGYRVELLHDSFCDHLFERKQKRQQWQKLLRILEIIGMLIIVGLISLLILINTDLDKKNKDAEMELQKKNEQIISKDQELQKKEELISIKDQELQKREELINNKDQELQKKEESLSSMDQTLSAAKAEKKMLEKDKIDLESQKIALVNEIEALNMAKKELEDSNKKKDSTIAKMKTQYQYSRKETNERLIKESGISAKTLLSNLGEHESHSVWKKFCESEDESHRILTIHVSEGDLDNLIKKTKDEALIQELLTVTDEEFVQRVNSIKDDEIIKRISNNAEILNKIIKNKKKIKRQLPK